MENKSLSFRKKNTKASLKMVQEMGQESTSTKILYTMASGKVEGEMEKGA